MDVESLKQDVVAGKVDVDRLIGLIDKLSKKLDAANQRIEELEKQLAGPTTKLDEAFSVESEEKRQEARGVKSPKERNAKPSGRDVFPRPRNWLRPRENRMSTPTALIRINASFPIAESCGDWKMGKPCWWLITSIVAVISTARSTAQWAAVSFPSRFSWRSLISFSSWACRLTKSVP